MDIRVIWLAFMAGMAWGAGCFFLGTIIRWAWLRKRSRTIFTKLLRQRRNGRGER